MELYSVATPEEQKLRDMADAKRIPLGGTLELLPMCNMDCRMCYVRLSREEMENQGRMLSADEWLKIIDQAIEKGLLFLLLTGGEPLLYPEFHYLYKELSNRGLILTVNSNGTLINEETAKMFSEYGCRRLNITLYGKDNETYADLCRNPKGFDQVMNAFSLLKKYNLPFRINCSVTPYNIDQLPEFYRIANELEAPLITATYMFPSQRKGEITNISDRLTAKEAGCATFECFRLKNPNANVEASVKGTLAMLNAPAKFADYEFGSTCHAGLSGFWMNWKGELTPCGMFSEPHISMLENSFSDCWDYVVKETSKLRRCPDCIKCEYQNICQTCLARSYTETGRTDGKPEYVCEMTKATYEVMLDYLKNARDN